jgi:N-acyl-D-aspartate/D-glutamate deacylase
MTGPGRAVIRGAEVADGSGGPVIRRDLLVSDGRIAAVGPAGAYDLVDAEIAEADGLVVTPGFIDVHSRDASATSATTATQFIVQRASHGSCRLAGSPRATAGGWASDSAAG